MTLRPRKSIRHVEHFAGAAGKMRTGTGERPSGMKGAGKAGGLTRSPGHTAFGSIQASSSLNFMVTKKSTHKKPSN